MFIEKVTAVAFAGLESREIEYTRGFNVVWGLNESGKSSFHEATTTLLVGRAPGNRTNVARAFKNRFYPWDGDDWTVSGFVVTKDGMRYQIVQDLGRESATAENAATGVSVSDFHNGGMFDGAKLVGLERDTFRQVAQIRQADILSIANGEVGELQDYLLRVATSRTVNDSTTEQAINNIASFQKDSVGSERSPSKPLRQSRSDHDQAIENQNAARHASAIQEQLDEESANAKAYLHRLNLEEQVAIAAEARTSAEHAAEELATIETLASDIQADPSGAAADPDIVSSATRTLTLYQARSTPAPLTGRNAAELREEIASIPPAPTGPTEVPTAVVVARNRLREANTSHASHVEDQPSEFSAPHTGGLRSAELLSIASGLEEQLPPEPIHEREAIAQAQEDLDRASGSTNYNPAGIGLLALAVLVALIGLIVEPISAVIGVLIGAFGFSQLNQIDHRSIDEARRILDERSNEFAQKNVAFSAATKRRSEIEARCHSAGIEPEPLVLRELAQQLNSAEVNDNEVSRWKARLVREREDLESAAHNLQGQLEGLGFSTDSADIDALLGAVDELEVSCRRNSDAVLASGTRSAMEEALADRVEAEATHAEAVESVERIERELVTIASRLGLTADTHRQASESLEAWIAAQEQLTLQAQDLAETDAELSGMLNGRTIESVRSDAASADELARDLCAGIDPMLLDESHDRRPIDEIRDDISRATANSAETQTIASEHRAKITSVAEATAEVERTRAVMERWQKLSDLAAKASLILQEAKQQVHNNIAPLIAEPLSKDINQITDGRYSSVKVDPDSLEVKVDTPAGLRSSASLSHGTAELLYLALRVRVLDLVTNDEPCPLLLDDATVHADEERTERILELLLEVSRNSQVILYTQEESVRRWAEAEQDVNLISLDRPAA